MALTIGGLLDKFNEEAQAAKRNEILFNYNQTMRQAANLDEAARRLDRLSSERMESALGTLRGAWQSDSSPQYFSKAGKVQGDLRASADKVRAAAKSIRTIAEAVKKAELAALDIARNRTYR